MSLSARFVCVPRAIVLSFLLFHAALFLLKLNSFDICACRCDLFCRLDNFALLQFLLSFIFVYVISFLNLFFKKCTHIEMKDHGIIYLTICYSQYCTNKYSSKFQRAHESNRNSCGYCFEKFPRERLQ